MNGFQYTGPNGEELTEQQQADYTRPLCAGIGPAEWSPPSGWSEGCAPTTHSGYQTETDHDRPYFFRTDADADGS